MRGFRITVLLLAFAFTAVAVTGIRIEQSRLAAQIQQDKLKQIALKRILQDQQLQIARLRSPEQIQERVNRLDLKIVSPEESQRKKSAPPSSEPKEMLAMKNRQSTAGN